MQQSPSSNSSYVWIYFMIPAIVWGGSFQVIKWGLVALSSYQLASIRLLSAGLCLLPFLHIYLRKLSGQEIKWGILAGITGAFFPSYLFCIAETNIDGTTAGILNSTTPVWALLLGILFFKHRLRRKQLLGVLFGFFSVLLLIVTEREIKSSSIPHALLILVATLMYATNVWIVGSKLAKVSVLGIATIGLTVNIVPAAIVLFFSDYERALNHPDISLSLASALFLGILASCLMGLLLYQLIKKSSAIFASMITYAIPVVAILVGWLFSNETITFWQLLGLLGVLSSIYLSQKNKHQVAK